MPTSPAADAVVIRFSPMEPGALLKSAAKEYRRIGAYRVSVFADRLLPGEDLEDLVRRLLAVSELTGIDPTSNRKYWMCAGAQELRSRHFTFHKDDYDGEPPEHYSVDLGNPPTDEDAARFVEVFENYRRPA